jgi:hypothetical protein
VWKRNEVLHPSVKVDFPAFADHIGQRVKRQELRDRQSSHREHQFGLKEFKLPPQPVRTSLNFKIGWNSVATTRIFSGKTAADRRKVDPAAHRFFIPIKRCLKPAKEGLARCPGKRTAKHGFFTTWSLPDEEDLAGHRASDYDRFVHGRASAAVRQRLKVRTQRAHAPTKSTEAIRKAM